jgi:microcin C transport system permease protein
MRMRAASAGMEGGTAGSARAKMTDEEINRIKAYYGFDKPIYLRYWVWLKKVMRLDFGESYFYEEPVSRVMISKFPVSLTFGLVGFFLSYLICIPLGIKKALKHGSLFDTVSSSLVFAGYSIPPFALGVMLIVFLCGGDFLNLFPIGGITSDNFHELSLFGKIADYSHHMFLPVLCYVIGDFALLTLLMKNSLIEQLSKDYMRTALAKGMPFSRAVRAHALRNALVPIATGLGSVLTLMFSGAILVETVFNIDGMGLLSYNSIINRDYNVAMGLIIFEAALALFGNILSDFAYVVIDPRITFQ